MKRKIDRPRTPNRIGSVDDDFSIEQLAGIGRIAMLYNEAESWIEAMFTYTTELPDALALEVSTRINGIDGKIEIIKAALITYGLEADTIGHISRALGDEAGGFKALKGYRDAVIHAQIVVAKFGIGTRVDRRARLYEVLLSKDALNFLSTSLRYLISDLRMLTNLIIHARMSRNLDPSDPVAKQLLANTAKWSARFQSHRKKKRSHLQPPEFPTEAELSTAHLSFFRENREALLRYVHEVADELSD